MRNETCDGFRATLMQAFGLCVLVASLLPAGCTTPSADAEQLLARALAVAEEEGLSLVPDESDDAAMVVRRHRSAWRPFARIGELGRQASAVTLTDGGLGSREAVLQIELKPDAARALLEERMEQELALVRQENGERISAAADGTRAPLSREMEQRIAAAEKQLADMLSAAEVRTIAYLHVDRSTAMPSRLGIETRIIRPLADSPLGGKATGRPAAAGAVKTSGGQTSGLTASDGEVPGRSASDGTGMVPDRAWADGNGPGRTSPDGQPSDAASPEPDSGSGLQTPVIRETLVDSFLIK